MNIYKIKSLVPGYKLSGRYAALQLVAVPTDKLAGGVTVVLVDSGQRMEITDITKPLVTKSFKDKFGRGRMYTLAYFEWRPAGEQLVLVGS